MDGGDLITGRGMSIPESSGDQCICGARWESTHFKAITWMFEIADVYALSCPTPGCKGNIAEKWTKTIEKLRKDLCEESS